MSRPSLRALLQGQAAPSVEECVLRWCQGGADGDGRGNGSSNGQGDTASASRGVRQLLARLAGAMEDEARVRQRIGELPRKLQDLLELFFADGGAVRTVAALFQEFGANFKSRFDLEASLAALHREAFVWPVKDKRWAPDGAGWAVPSELAGCVQLYRQRRERQLQDTLTLQGFLEARFFKKRDDAGGGAGNGRVADAKAAEAKAKDHARKIYKLYTLETAMRQRLDKLPAAVRQLCDVTLCTHGGIVEHAELLREVELKSPPDAAFLGKSLEEAMLGTVAPLDLARIGVRPLERAVVVFHEVALWAIRERGEQQRPQVTEELVAGGDFASNVGRFLRELQQSKVLFTAEGDLFKASQKRIAQQLLPLPGALLEPEPMLEVIYRFCLFRRFVDRRGERSLRPTPSGLEFERSALGEQTKLLLAQFVEDRTLPGEPYHHTRMRRVLLRLLRRAEPLIWQDVSVLPFLSRNAYLAQLDTRATEEFFAARFQGGGYTPSETLQQMCWNLLVWIKKRLYPLGLVDVGMHQGRITALRLSRLGAELLDAEPAGRVGGTRSSVVVQPDFEILLFPGDDVHEVAHLFDRFARRTKSDRVLQFSLDEASVTAALDDGMDGASIVQELNDRARAPLPQNVLYSLEEWIRSRRP